MIIFIFLITFFLAFSPVSEAVSVSPGQPAPSFTLNSIGGKYVSLSEYKGEVVILIYWKTGHERSLMALKDADQEMKKYDKKGVRAISVIADSDSKEEAASALKSSGIDFPVLIDADRQLYSNYGIRVYPSTIIIDKQGMVAYDIPSHAPSYRNTLDGYIRQVLGEISEEELKSTLAPHREDQDKAKLEALRLYNLSLKFAQSGMLEQATDAAIKSVEAKPDMAQSHILLGFLQLENRNADSALQAFNKAVDLEPRSHDAQTGLGGALLLKGDVDRAIEVLNNAATANPYPQSTYYQLGKAYELKGDKDRAIEMYKKAMEKIIKKQILPSAISRCQ
ncbi:MAG: hypothetical protein C4538_04115 [Nitrospiraceae bacterium]|nr:MAG: hypothetical protein C4538_04115 [Nitrospiraceae bacterium]